MKRPTPDQFPGRRHEPPIGVDDPSDSARASCESCEKPFMVHPSPGYVELFCKDCWS